MFKFILPLIAALLFFPGIASAELSIKIDISAQRLYVHDDGVVIDSSPISSGRRGYEIPIRDYTVINKYVFARSNRYNNAAMPYYIGISRYVGIHAGKLPGYPASHGCIRLPRAFAKKLFNMIPIGTTVKVIG